VTRVQSAVATTSREALIHVANDVEEEDTPLWMYRTNKSVAAQAVIVAGRANPLTEAEKETIAARNIEFGRESQEAMRYECRRTMTNVITFELVRQGLTNATMRIKAAEVSSTCASTDIFKEKLTQMEEILVTKSKPAPLASRNRYINKVTEDFEGKEDSRNVNAVGNKKKQKKGKGKGNQQNGQANAVNKPPPPPR
jgi:hypothetical protein